MHSYFWERLPNLREYRDVSSAVAGRIAAAVDWCTYVGFPKSTWRKVVSSERRPHVDDL
jgi:hypothetical protein